MTINGVHGGIGNRVEKRRGDGHLNAYPGGGGLEGIIEVCPGGIYKSVPRGVHI